MIKTFGEESIKGINFTERGKLMKLTVSSIFTNEIDKGYHYELIKNIKEALEINKIEVEIIEKLKFINQNTKKGGTKNPFRESHIILKFNKTFYCVVNSLNFKTCLDPNYKEEIKFQIGELVAVLHNENICVDEYMSDQLIIFMALSKEECKIRILEESLHFQSVIYVVEQFMKNKEIIRNKYPNFIEVIFKEKVFT